MGLTLLIPRHQARLSQCPVPRATAPFAGSRPEAPVPPILQGKDTSLATPVTAAAASQSRLHCITAGSPGSAPLCHTAPGVGGGGRTCGYTPIDPYTHL